MGRDKRPKEGGSGENSFQGTGLREEMQVIDLDMEAGWQILDLPAEESCTEYIEQAEIENVGGITEEILVNEAVSAIAREEFLMEELTIEDLAIEDLSIKAVSASVPSKKRAFAEEEEDPYEPGEGKGKVVSFSRFGMMDRILIGTGLIVLILAVVVAGSFWNKRTVKQQIAAFAPLGEQLETVGVIGAETLVAVADARKAAEETAKIEEEMLKEAERKEAERKEEKIQEIEVVMKLSTVQKDLKIKFVNRKNGKLVRNLLFEVKITDPSGKSYHHKDEDKDGILHLTKLDAGSYSVSMVGPEGVQGYSFSTKTETIRVKESIEYQKVDVSDEIKKESEVDLSKEDTSAKVETEAVLTDTVEWVNTGKIEVPGGETYVQINKGEIADPSVRAGMDMLRSFYFTSSASGSEGAGGAASSGTEAGNSAPKTEASPSTANGTAQPEGSNPTKSEENNQAKPEEGNQAKPEDSNQAKPEEGNQAKPEDSNQTNPEQNNPAKPEDGSQTKPEEKPAQPGGNSSSSGQEGTSQPQQPQHPQQPQKVEVTAVNLSQSAITLTEGSGAALTAAVVPDNASEKTVVWSSSSDAVAKVDGNGNIAAVAAGQAVITAKAGGKTASCTVTVTARPVEVKISLDRTEIAVKTGESFTLNASVNPAGKTLTWTSSNSNVAIVENGKVTAKAAGETVITVSAEGKSAGCKVVVTNVYDARQDNSTALKTRSGKQVYYYADGKYIEAKVADYFKYSTFYTKESIAQVKYTGWQNLDGKTYYFDKNGNPVTGEQIIQGAKYTFNSDGSLHTGSGILGIDVSTFNGDINWSQVKNAGVSYVIIRTGFRGSTKGALIEDAKFRQNIQGAAAVGLKIGVYFFTQAINEVEAVEEASMVLSQIKGYPISYPVFIDVESSGGRADGLDAGTRTRVINAFCQTIQNGGYRAGIYANKTWLSQKMNISALSGYKIWLAQYNSQVSYNGRYDMWQYSDKGRIPGISTNVDMNLSYMNY